MGSRTSPNNFGKRYINNYGPQRCSKFWHTRGHTDPLKEDNEQILKIKGRNFISKEVISDLLINITNHWPTFLRKSQFCEE